MFKKLRNRIESKRNSDSFFWRLLVLIKDILWRVTHRFYKIEEELFSKKIFISRKKQLEKNIPDIWFYKTVLYIGARRDRMQFVDDFKKNKYKIDILEIFKPNVEFLKKLKWINKIILGDVREIDKITDKKYDVIFWWHGPEHILKKELGKTLNKIKNKAKFLAVCGCPLGETPQGKIFNNPWEKHSSSLNRKDFENHGFNADIVGKKNMFGSNILAWYKKN